MAIVAFCFTPQYRNTVKFPEQLRMTDDQITEVVVGFPLTVHVRPDQDNIVKVNGNPLNLFGRTIDFGRPVSIEPVSLGKVTLEFRLLGFIPFKRLAIDVIPRLKLHAGGHSIGVLLHSDGVSVVGLSAVNGTDGRTHYPARDAGVEIGDLITDINGQPVSDDEQVAQLVDEIGRLGQPAVLTIRRNGQVQTRTIRLVLCEETRRYRMGLWIRDGAAGVGTMTFFDPQSRRYGALGHVIADMDTNRPIEIEDGQIVAASVSRIEPGKRGQPGEKIGTFSHNRDAIGTIDRNTPFGIMGYLFKPPESNLYSEPLPIAMMNEVRPGPAKIVTVISGRKLEEFDVEIVRVNPQPTPHAKGMVIKVVDRRLLAATGGIVQGMSGSPIIQDGRLVGAVTHVFVNDPTKGYGVFIEWMIIDSGILESQQNISAA